MARRNPKKGSSVPVALADLARLRQAAYQLFGAVLLYPNQERLTDLVAAARELERQGQAFAGFVFFPQWRKFLISLTSRKGSKSADLEEAYRSLFVLKQGVPLCESGFLAPETPGLTMAALDGEYSKVGLCVGETCNEPPDHVAVELEFMGLLCGEEAKAWRKRSFSNGVHGLKAEVGFLNGHLARWLPIFADQVTSRAGDGFYGSAVRAAHAFIEHDRELTAALLEQHRQEATHGG
jgi:TorA maturation chaperone TorD